MTSPATPTNLPRVFQLAKQLDVPATSLLARANSLGIEVRSVLNALDDTEVRRILEDYRDDGVGTEFSPNPESLDEALASLPPAPRDTATWSPMVLINEDELAVAEPADTEQPVEQTTAQAEDLNEFHDWHVDSEVDATEVYEDEAPAALPEVDDPVESSKPAIARVAARWRGLDQKYRIIGVGIGILVGVMLLTTLYALLRPTYAAESDVVISISGLGSEEIEREMQSFNVVAASNPVLSPVAEEFGIPIQDLREDFSSEIIGDSTLLRFTTNAGSPEQALALNEAIVASYLEVANQSFGSDELAFITTRIDQVTEDLTTLDEELADLEAQEATSASARLQLDTERTVVQARLADLEGRLVDLRASGAAPAGSIAFVEGQINDTEAELADLVTETQTLETEDAAVRGAANRLRDERSILRSELADLQAMAVDLELNQIVGTRAAVLSPGRVVDGSVGLTPSRAIVLGLLVGGALAFVWVVAATQLRKEP